MAILILFSSTKHLKVDRKSVGYNKTTVIGIQIRILERLYFKDNFTWFYISLNKIVKIDEHLNNLYWLILFIEIVSLISYF